MKDRLKLGDGVRILAAGVMIGTAIDSALAADRKPDLGSQDPDRAHVLDLGKVQDPFEKAGIALENPDSSERQELPNPFVLKQARVEIGEGSFFLTRPDGVIKELSENEIAELAPNQQYLLLLAEQGSLAKDVSQTYALDNPRFFHNLYFYKEGNNLFIAGVTTFEEQNGQRGIVFKDITDFAMPFYLQPDDSFGVIKLPDGRMIPHYKNKDDPNDYTLTVGESLEPTSASLTKIPAETQFESLEPIVFPQSISPKEGRVNVRQGPSTASQVLTTLDSSQELPVLGVVNMPGTGLWHAVPLSNQEGNMVVAFVSSEVTKPQNQMAQGELLITPVPQDQLVGYGSEISVDAFDEIAAIYEIAKFTEPQMASSDGRYTLYYSQDYLREEAKASKFVFDQGAVDAATNLIFEKSFGELNSILASQGKPTVQQTDVVTLRPFVQRGSRIENTNSIEGVISKIKHYAVTFEEMDRLREAIQENPNATETIDLRAFGYSGGFGFFDQTGDNLIIITHPGRARSAETNQYLNRYPLGDGPITAYVFISDVLVYGEAGMGIYSKVTNADDIYSKFGCTVTNPDCNPNLVSIK